MARELEATMRKLLLEELRFRRGGMVGWGIGLCLLPVIYVSLYPTFAEQMSGFQAFMDLAIYQAMGMSMASFEDYLASTVTNLVPMVLCIYAVVNGTGTLAGEEDSGRLELIVALPIPRWQIAAVKAVALGIGLFVILAIVAAGAAITLAIIGNQVETLVAPIDVFLNLLAAWPLAMSFGMISLALGAFSPSRRVAATIATVVVLVSYLGSNVTGMISSLEGLRYFFLFYFYDATAGALENGQQAGDLSILFTTALVAFGVAVTFFQRRDITVGAWPWQRGKTPAGGVDATA
jgi:ABC-2 type transport system permease protein